MICEQSRRANEHTLSVDNSLDASARNRREVAVWQHIEAAPRGLLDNGARQGMLGVDLRRGREPQEAPLIKLHCPLTPCSVAGIGTHWQRNEIGDGRLALSEGAGLIEDDRLDARGLLQGGGVLD